MPRRPKPRHRTGGAVLSGTDGAWLREARGRMGLTQAALAAALDYQPNSVAMMERGERPVTRVTRLAVERLGEG